MTTGLAVEDLAVVDAIGTCSVGIVGLGYVGLPTALALVASGASVTGLDASKERLEVIRAGVPDLLPSDLDRLSRARTAPLRFRLTDDPTLLVESDSVIICVPTPVDQYNTPDLTALRKACDTVTGHARRGQTIILTSTSYVGCTRDLLEAPLRKRGFVPGEDVYVAFAPERIDPANMRYEQADVPRLVGGITPSCVERAARVLVQVNGSIHAVSSVEVAELSKLLENTFRAVNIALANEFAEIAHTMGLDPIEVITAAATKPYGFMPFYPGPGIGGHCIPCDPHYLLWQLRREHVHPPVISAAMESVSTRPLVVVERTAQALESRGKSLCGAKVLVVGLSYKPNVADTRESPARSIIAGLVRRGAHISVQDPLVASIEVDGVRYRSLVADPDMGAYDAVVVCCLHEATERTAFGDARLVLDATYSLPAADNRIIP
jgi:nucleotide sugar dehydrogenase